MVLQFPAAASAHAPVDLFVFSSSTDTFPTVPLHMFGRRFFFVVVVVVDNAPGERICCS